MMHRNAAKLFKKKPRGRPFQKGRDPRRHMAGQINKGAVKQTRKFAALIKSISEEKTTIKDEKGIQTTHTNLEWLARRLYARAISGDTQAVEAIVKRIDTGEAGPGGEGGVTVTITPAGDFKINENKKNGNERD